MGAAFLASPVLGMLSLPGGLGLLLSDYVLFAGLCLVGVHELRRHDDSSVEAAATELTHA